MFIGVFILKWQEGILLGAPESPFPMFPDKEGNKEGNE